MKNLKLIPLTLSFLCLYPLATFGQFIKIDKPKIKNPIKKPNIPIKNPNLNPDDIIDILSDPEKGIKEKVNEAFPENVLDGIGGYDSNKGKLIEKVKENNWKPAFADDISERDVRNGIVATGVSVYTGSSGPFIAWVELLVERTITSLEQDLEKEAKAFKSEAKKIAREAIYAAIKGEKTNEILKKYDTIEVKAGAFRYSGHNYFASNKIGPPTWGLKPYVAFRLKSSSNSTNPTSPTGTRIKLNALNSEVACPENGSIARQFFWNSSNSSIAIRCSRAPNANIKKEEFWTRPFMSLDSSTGEISSVQSSTCPDNRFVNEIVFKNNTFHIRCRYMNIGNRQGKWSTGTSFFTRRFLSPDFKSISGAECPNNSAVAHVIKLSDGGLAIRCRRVIVDGNVLDIQEDKYWTRYFAELKYSGFQIYRVQQEC